MPHSLISEIESKYIRSLVSRQNRVDGRGLREIRPITIECGIVEKACGSAKVSIGNTKVIVGVSAEIGAPYPDAPNSGVVTCAAEFVPMASPSFEPGPPNEESIELARVVDRGVRESKMVDVDKLCIIPNEKVWIIFVDIYVIDHSGNLFDAASLAAVSALLTTKLPKTVVEDGKVKKLDEKIPLPVSNIPISLTFAKIDDQLCVDPILEEENVMDARITLVYDVDGNLVAAQKGERGALTTNDIYKAIDLAEGMSKEISEKYISPLLKREV
ncbi:MAG: exosome complex protein Rrp42 [Candidatus Jordarchaeaceae archaeon]